MKDFDPMRAFLALLETVGVGILTTIGEDGYPRSRWMTAATIAREHGYLYCVTVAGTRKVRDLDKNDKVEWSFQSPSLDQVAQLRGRAVSMDNPQLKAEVLEALGSNLENFWRVNPDPRRLIVIETAIEKVKFYKPMENLIVEREAAE